MFFLFLCFVVVAASTEKFIPLTVKIKSGWIEGEMIQNQIYGNQYFSFRGIPYAKPPLGNLRFQAPQPPEPWNGTLPTKKDGPKCVQAKGGSENCLHLNVFTTKISNGTKNENLMPVIMWIHGGAFVHRSGSSKIYGPEFLIPKGIVLVVINYRLNVFGFLNTLDEAAPCNAGLKDQIAALKWIKNNIVKFSGNPNQVTIAGHSAGAASVQYLMQSDEAKGLFHRAIAQSGSILNKWSFQKRPKEKLFKLATGLGFNTKNTKELVGLLQTVDAEKLFKAFVNRTAMGEFRELEAESFVPSLEAFKNKCFYEIFTDKNYTYVPFLTGYATGEALIFLPAMDKLIIEFSNDLELFIPDALNIEKGSKVVTDEILGYFFRNKSVTDKQTFINFQSQEMFIRGIRKSVDIMRSNHDVYFYRFSFKSDKTAQFQGVAHAEELKYLFYSGGNETEQEKIVREQFTTLWANFIKTGNPTPEKDPLLDNIYWPPVSKNNYKNTEYLEIGKQLTVGLNVDQNDYEFWENLFNKYGNNHNL